MRVRRDTRAFIYRPSLSSSYQDNTEDNRCMIIRLSGGKRIFSDMV